MNYSRQFSLRALMGVMVYCCATFALMANIGHAGAGLSVFLVGMFLVLVGADRGDDRLVGKGCVVTALGLAVLVITSALLRDLS